MKAVRTCILVADGTHARVFLNEGPNKGIEELHEYAEDKALRQSGEIATDEPGRTFDSGGEGRHAMEPPTDPKRHEKQEFHRELAGRIEADMKKNRFDRLVLVAPPRTLGNLREQFARADAVKIHAEINKDLIKVGHDELAKHLGEVIAL